MTRRRNMTSTLFEEYNVNSESELAAKLEEESNTIPCIYCHREHPIERIRFMDGDPVCNSCWSKLRS